MRIILILRGFVIVCHWERLVEEDKHLRNIKFRDYPRFECYGCNFDLCAICF